jgi:hypothetical protein
MLDDMRALSAHNLGDKAKAVEYGESALKGNPSETRLKNNLVFYRQGI